MTVATAASSTNPTVADAAKAIGLCSAGAVHEGVALYVQVLNAMTERGHPLYLPVGLHLRFLEGMGLSDAAATIRREGLRTGQNLCVSAVLDKPPDKVIAEYRQLFADSVVNSTMVADYLVKLSTLGETDELNSWLDVRRFVHDDQLLPIDEDGQGDGFSCDAVAAMLLNERNKDNWYEESQSVRKMHFFDLHDVESPIIRRLFIAVRARVTRYIADVAPSDWPAGSLSWLPRREFGIRAWTVISTGEGYNVPHIHHRSAISGILYVAGSDEVGADGQPVGALRIGPDKRVENAAGWPDLVVAPKRGLLILMPSYFTHWTVPMGKPGLRISIAFDVVDASPTGHLFGGPDRTTSIRIRSSE